MPSAITDSTGRRKGLCYGNPSLIASPSGAAFGNALLLDGAADYVELDWSTHKSGPFTVEIRFRRDRNDRTEHLARLVLGGATCLLQLIPHNPPGAVGVLMYQRDGSHYLFTPGAVTLGTHSAALTFDGTTLRLYLDGVLQASGGVANVLDFAAIIDHGSLGSDGFGGSFFQGAIDEFHVSKIARYTGASYTVATTPAVADADTTSLWQFAALETANVWMGPFGSNAPNWSIAANWQSGLPVPGQLVLFDGGVSTGPCLIDVPVDVAAIWTHPNYTRASPNPPAALTNTGQPVTVGELYLRGQRFVAGPAAWTCAAWNDVSPSSSYAGMTALTFAAAAGTQASTFNPAENAGDVTVHCPGAGTAFTSDLRCVSFRHEAGELDRQGHNITTDPLLGNVFLLDGAIITANSLSGATDTVGGTFDARGHAGALLDLRSPGWILNVTGAARADYVRVSNSNAAGGSVVTAQHSTDDGGNTHWLFLGDSPMPMLIPNEGEVQLLKDVLAIGGAAGVVTLEAWTLKLFKNDYTPTEADTSASFTEADFTSYASKALVRDGAAGHWTTPASAAPTGSWNSEASVAEATYASQVFTALSTQMIYGYYIVGATSGKVIAAERFATPQVISVSSPLAFTPRFGAA